MTRSTFSVSRTWFLVTPFNMRLSTRATHTSILGNAALPAAVTSRARVRRVCASGMRRTSPFFCRRSIMRLIAPRS